MNALHYTRRDFLERAGLGFGLLGLSALAPSQTIAAPSPLAPKPSHFRPRAKHVIHIFFNGGLSHVDSFDPKPALSKYDGQALPRPNLVTERSTGEAFASPFRFEHYGQSGIPISEIFAPLGQHADDLAIVRSMQCDVPNHEPSLMLMNCGDNTLPRPSLGSWLTYGLGTENQNLPGFVAMCPGGFPVKGPDNWRSAFLPGIHEGMHLDTQHTDVHQLISNIRNPERTPPEQRPQLDLLKKLNLRNLELAGNDPSLEARIQSYEQAFRMQLEATDAFDIEREPQWVRERYGNDLASRQLLLARRLVERGVRFVQAWHGAWQPWDNHSNIESEHRKLAREVAPGIAALIADLKERGLFDETLLIIGGEFGRTPTVEQSAAGKATLGRDHNPYGFSMILAGGGIRGGMTYGATDEFGFQAVEKPTHVHDLHATILHALGLDHEKLTYRHASRDFRLTDVGGRVIDGVLG